MICDFGCDLNIEVVLVGDGIIEGICYWCLLFVVGV